jgi:hypothetical protein
MPINFIFFWILTIFAIRMGDPIGIVLCIACFTIMNVFCEEMDKEEKDNEDNYFIRIKESND